MKQNQIPIFISSVHYGLEDLRGTLASFVEEELGGQPLLSSEKGFPDYPGEPPYAQCLLALEKCLLVVGILDRRYGMTFEEWGCFRQYKGLSPTHAELRHALDIKKPLIIYVRQEVQAYYDVYRKNRELFKKAELPKNLDLKTLTMFEELKIYQPAPWIESFRDVRDIKNSLRQKLLHYLHDALSQREALIKRTAEVLVDVFLQADRDKKEVVVRALDEILAAKLERYDDIYKLTREQIIDDLGEALGHEKQDFISTDANSEKYTQYQFGSLSGTFESVEGLMELTHDVKTGTIKTRYQWNSKDFVAESHGTIDKNNVIKYTFNWFNEDIDGVGFWLVSPDGDHLEGFWLQTVDLDNVTFSYIESYGTRKSYYRI